MFSQKTRITVSEGTQHNSSITEHVVLDIPNMFGSRASITAANVHHLALGPEYKTVTSIGVESH